MISRPRWRSALQRLGERRPCARGLGSRLEQHEDRDEADRHQRRGAEERPAPGDVAEQAAEQRAGGDAEPERGLVEDDRARRRRRCAEPMITGERGGDEERVAEAPAGAEADDLADRAGRAGERGEDDRRARARRAACCAGRSGWRRSR